MVFQLRTIPIYLLVHHLFLQDTIVNENIYIASLIFVMDLNDNEYKKNFNISKRQSKVLNRRTNKTLTKVKGQQTANKRSSNTNPHLNVAMKGGLALNASLVNCTKLAIIKALYLDTVQPVATTRSRIPLKKQTCSGKVGSFCSALNTR
jgi:hypothetical protein